MLLGEIHDNPIHHRNQAAMVRDIRPSALVFEMFSPQAADAAQDIDRNDPVALAEGLGWDAAGWPNFDTYHPIFVAAPEAALYGAALPRDAVRRAVTDGAAAVLDTPGLFPALSTTEQEEREAGQMSAHCDALPPEMLPGMVDAQRVRDAAFAQAALLALRETGGPVAVITGNGHVRRDWGMPVYLERLAPGISVSSMGQLETPPEADPPFELWVVTNPVERDDPCAAFRGAEPKN